jgi:hypothetical protein
MLRTAGPMTKVAAERLIAQEGYPEQFDTGECGDGGYGSRLYFRKGPDAPTNEHWLAAGTCDAQPPRRLLACGHLRRDFPMILDQVEMLIADHGLAVMGIFPIWRAACPR